MNPLPVLLSVIVLVAAAFAQPIPGFFGPSFHGSFEGFGEFPSPQIVGSPVFPSGGGRPNTGPILFPPAPESRDTSGVIVGASGYGFVPPGANEIAHGRGFQSSTPFQPGLRQSSFGNYFHL